MTGSRTPPELLDRIFSKVEHCYSADLEELDDPLPDHLLMGEDWLDIQIGKYDGELCKSMFRPHASLAPFLTVSKQWRDVAERRLYHSITIVKQDKDEKLQKLLHTLTQNSRLAELVRELRFRQYTGTAEVQARIIETCPNLERLTMVLAESRDHTIEPLKAALSNSRGLKSLVFVRQEDEFSFLPGGKPRMAICGAKELVDWLVTWPKIEYLAIWDIYDGEPFEAYDLLANLAARSAGICSQLRRLYTNIALPPSFLHAFATIAPSVTSLDFALDSAAVESPAVLSDIFRIWAPGLEHLYVRMGSDKDTALDYALDPGVCEQFRSVKKLRVTSRLIAPASLVHFTNASRLEYIVMRLPEVKGLAEAIPSMTSLKSVRVMKDLTERQYPAWRDTVQVLRPICAARGIRVTYPRMPLDWHDTSDFEDYDDYKFDYDKCRYIDSDEDEDSEEDGYGYDEFGEDYVSSRYTMDSVLDLIRENSHSDYSRY